MSIEHWEHFFKPEVRSSGRRLFVDGVVSVSQPSDTEIQAFIKVSSSSKVNLKSPSVSSPLISADCTCPASQKGQLCKHIWATLLAAEEKKPDFFDGKTEIEKKTLDDDTGASPSSTSAKGNASFAKPSFKTAAKKPLSEAQMQSQAAYKAKQNEYRKQQYQKQKQRLKDKKQSGKQSKFASTAPTLPKPVEEAYKFFLDNGFPMDNPPKAEAIQQAKKKLSRIFHPDIGGSHDEITELNRNCDILFDYLEENF